MAIYRLGFGLGVDKTRLTDRLDLISNFDNGVNFAKHNLCSMLTLPW